MQWLQNCYLQLLEKTFLKVDYQKPLHPVIPLKSLSNRPKHYNELFKFSIFLINSKFNSMNL